MPNRILRDWTDSATMDKLSWQEEVVFTRLIMKADDFGNFYRNSSLVKSLLFPRKEGLRPSDIDRWLLNIESADLIRCYTVKSESYLHIRNFKQRLDRTSRKFPEEPADINDDNHSPRTAADGSEPPPETKRNEVETEEEGDSGSSPPPSNDDLLKKRRESFINGLSPFVDTYGKDMVNAFYRYWSEPNKSKTKMRWELEKTWDVNMRLITWANRDKNFKKNNE